jgi:hypothetical protein
LNFSKFVSLLNQWMTCYNVVGESKTDTNHETKRSIS